MAPLTLILIIEFPIIGLIGYYMKTKNQERMKLIEKGIDPDDGNMSEYRKQSLIKNGVLFISIAVGLFTGHLLTIHYEKLDGFITYLTMVLLFGGIGFLINYLILKNWNTRQ